MSTIAQLVADVLAAPAPVVFLDSCSILDIARAPREHPDSVPAATDLIQLTNQTPRAIHLLRSDIVQKEWDDNIGSAESATETALTAYENVIRVASSPSIAAYSGLHQPLPTLRSILRTLSQSLLNSCRVIDREGAAVDAAINRVVNKQRPSQKKR